MKRSLWMGTLFLAGAGALAAQQASQDQLQGTSNPPPDDTITTYQEPVAKPAPGRPMVQPAPEAAQQQPAAAGQGSNQTGVLPLPDHRAAVQNAQSQGGAADDGIVMLAPDGSSQPTLNQRRAAADPDGDIVHPAPPPPGTLVYGTIIRARLLDELSTSSSEQGDTFRATVASDVVQDGVVLIPTGAEIDGTVATVSTGHFAGHGSMLLRPQTVILPNGSKYRLYAQVAGTPGAHARVGNEGQIAPGSQLKKDGILYGGGVGVGMIAGGAIAGPAGVLAGSIVGASAVTAHLLLDHPQATLREGTVLLFSLTQELRMESATEPGPQARGDQPADQKQVAVQ